MVYTICHKQNKQFLPNDSPQIEFTDRPKQFTKNSSPIAATDQCF